MAEEEQQEQRCQLAGVGQVTAGGTFEILAITAGTGNGWEFSEDCLRGSLALWDGAQCFVDHSYWGHSIRDLAGVCHQPEWDGEAKGIKLQLRPVGPSAGILQELGRQMLAEGETKPNVGFSADILFTSQARKVNTVLKVLSVDLVMNPARGGVFKRVLNSLNPYSLHSAEGYSMADEKQEKKEAAGGTLAAGTTLQAQLQADSEAVRQMLGEQQRQAELAAEAEKAREVRAQMCSYLLDSALGAAKLPAAAAERLRAQFAGKVFEPAELQSAIDDTRKLVSELTGGLVIQGPGRVHGMYSSEDQLQAAVDDLFGLERSTALQSVQAARLSGIRELYLMLTGDDDLRGGYYPERVRLATTTEFTGLVKNALNKIVVNTWDELGRAGYDWWKRISTVEHFSTLNDITGTLVGTVGDLATVAEGGEYQAITVGDSPETASFVKYGGYIPLTLELIDRDETRKLKAYPRELAAAGLRKISSLVAALFTANSGTGPDMADTGKLFNATAVTTAGGHANLTTTALAAAQWEVICQAVYDQPMLIANATDITGTGPKMAVNPRYLLVPRALQLTAMKILYPSLENAANIYSENQQRGQPGDVITVPEWTDAKDYAAVCDPRIAPAIYVGERFGLMPEVFIAGNELSPAVFTHDTHRLKVRHFLAVWVNDFRPLHKANVV